MLKKKNVAIFFFFFFFFFLSFFFSLIRFLSLFLSCCSVAFVFAHEYFLLFYYYFIIFFKKNTHTGTLDTLMSLMDELVKHDSFVGGVCSKLAKQLIDFEMEAAGEGQREKKFFFSLLFVV